MERKRIAKNRVSIGDRALYGFAPSNAAKLYYKDRQVESAAFATEKFSGGSVIVTQSAVGTAIAAQYNAQVARYIESGAFEHQTLCEAKPRAIGLLYLPVEDVLAEESASPASTDTIAERFAQYLDMYIQTHQHVIDYVVGVVERHIARPKISQMVNFLLMYNCEQMESLSVAIGRELRFYRDNTKFGNDIGILCQILAPAGFPHEKYYQIDIGLTTCVKRMANQYIFDAVLDSLASQNNIKLSESAIHTGARNEPLYYGKNGDERGWYKIFVFEAFYKDQISIVESETSSTFCKCADRSRAASKPR